ncbi:unnamed protein product [[Actinomadura] parvosata subsp. kistnae]|nr:unnamed protein product [Actinomadura parvosata subsp. kistnae]
MTPPLSQGPVIINDEAPGKPIGVDLSAGRVAAGSGPDDWGSLPSREGFKRAISGAFGGQWSSPIKLV